MERQQRVDLPLSPRLNEWPLIAQSGGCALGKTVLAWRVEHLRSWLEGGAFVELYRKNNDI
jgi:hypothetical protein